MTTAAPPSTAVRAPSSRGAPSPAAGALRGVVGIAGGWLFAYGYVAFVVAALARLGVSFHDAEHAAWLTAFVVFLVVLCGAFVARRTWLAALAVVGGGLALGALARLIAPGVAG